VAPVDFQRFGDIEHEPISATQATFNPQRARICNKDCQQVLNDEVIFESTNLRVVNGEVAFEIEPTVTIASPTAPTAGGAHSP
ncbi:MAG TPA: hypothetical protein VFX03_06460, partial [Thermomicrobiales bacterium]|nr:hypothetical protein [Thermomicrobiales bacterium]